MMDPLSPSGYNRAATDKAAANRPAPAEKAPAAAAPERPQAAAPARLQDDTLELSDAARQSMAEPGFDRAKVDAIKLALQQGQYPLDSRRMAENFLAIEKMISG
jgi:negative regulator of flagellin synthesis FlgM